MLISGYPKHFYCPPDLKGTYGAQVIKRCGSGLSHCGPIGSVDHPMFISLVLDCLITIVIFKNDKIFHWFPDQWNDGSYDKTNGQPHICWNCPHVSEL